MFLFTSTYLSACGPCYFKVTPRKEYRPSKDPRAGVPEAGAPSKAATGSAKPSMAPHLTMALVPFTSVKPSMAPNLALKRKYVAGGPYCRSGLLHMYILLCPYVYVYTCLGRGVESGGAAALCIGAPRARSECLGRIRRGADPTFGGVATSSG